MEGNEGSKGSPKASPVEVSDCLEDLVKFVLESSINHTLGSDLGLSNRFISGLLKDDDDGSSSTHPSTSSSCASRHFCANKELFHDFEETADGECVYMGNSTTARDFSEGVPPYPLYKHLASALERWIISGSFFPPCENVPPIFEDDSLKQTKNKWNELVSQKGSQLVIMLKSINFEIHVQEPFFSQLKDGLKTIEGRCATGDYNRIRSGDLILVNKCLMLEVQDVHDYDSFVEMLEMESLQKILPGVPTIEEGEQIYRKFYTKEKEQLNGVIAICVTRPASQPYSVLSDIMSGFGYRGFQNLLGLKQTVGTIPKALPPPRSTLLSSFTWPHKLDVKGCGLTDGARSLTKHVNRCSYWGELDGDDSTKNRLAVVIINLIMLHCRWMNVHIVQPHGVVFEVRVPEGYGARWSKDGTKFIGFLEPYMEDGHAKKWRH